MLKAEYIQECRCGAVTVFFPGGVSNSMTRATFEALHSRASGLRRKPITATTA